jgi:hypothetical protein
MVTRVKSTKSTAKTPIQAAAEATFANVEADKPIVDPVIDEAQRAYNEAKDNLLSKLPSGKRLLLSTIGALITYASTIWFAAPVIEILVVGAISLTGSAFLGFLVGVVGWFLAIWAGISAGCKAFGFLVSFDTDNIAKVGSDLRDASKRRVSLVRGWFARGAKSEDAVVAAA